MKIFTNKNELILVDDLDATSDLLRYKWRVDRHGYVVRSVPLGYPGGKKRSKSERLHRVIMGHPAYSIDHVNGNKLDNRRSNLRPCNNSQNQANARLPKNNTSGYKGVTRDKHANKWQVYLGSVYLGAYRELEQAVKIYNYAAIERYGEYARINLWPTT